MKPYVHHLFELTFSHISPARESLTSPASDLLTEARALVHFDEDAGEMKLLRRYREDETFENSVFVESTFQYICKGTMLIFSVYL
ncbi:MAG: uncharacterized protein KVP18_002499 [Porospora cf. gigantea A]|uniref:uncharacterized protein n=1 Tax=Porospora cf. gigantea A TaxID=2853593 RepID=UPI00355A2BDB|nr:MAG: hypothetical protein KVP18_002499 [Porospora cf. gigantea A]